MPKKENIAIILAGGTGTRAGFSVPKQFVKLAGRTMIERTVDAFQQNPLITGIVIVSNIETLEEMRSLVLQNRWTKLKAVCAGGMNRFASGNAGLSQCDSPDCNVLIHDGARPMVSQRIITEVCEALNKYSAVDVAVPSTDSLIVSDGNRVSNYLDRNTVWNVQTPQGFGYETIRTAYTEALRREDFGATDDCSVVSKYLPETEIALVRGDINNIKLTYPADKERVEQLIEETKQS